MDEFRYLVTKGVVYLAVRRVSLQIIITFSNIFLARILAPEIFGGFAIISFLVLSLGLITGFGLTQALIQKRGEIKKEELRATFTAVFLTTVVFSAIIYFFAPHIVNLYTGKIGDSGIFWLRIYLLYLIFLNLSTVSTTLLEKKLDYKRLMIGDVSTLMLTQILAVLFAVKGLGIGSFVLSAVIGRFVALFIYFILSPWSIGFDFSFFKLKKFIGFGLDYQFTNIIGIINGSVVPVFVATVSGARAVGLINWAAGVRQVGLAPYDLVQRMIFPASSYIQDKRSVLKVLTERILRLSSMLGFPMLAAITALAPSIISIVYTSIWLDGLITLYLSLIQGFFMLLGGVMIEVLWGLGRSKFVRNINFFWAIGQWMLTIPLVLLWNFNGFVLAGIILSSTFFIPLREVQKEIDVDFWPNVLPYLTYSAITGIFLFVLSRFILIDSIFKLIGVAVIGVLFYWGALFLFKRQIVINEVKAFKKFIWR